VDDLAPGVEQVILECIDPDPSQRPRSAIAVATRLPGGDPLAAVLAGGGEPPSPEHVAESGTRGGLSLRSAGLMVLGIVGAALLLIGATRPTSLLAIARPAKTVEVLRDRAHELVANLGYERDPVDSFASISYRTSLLERVRTVPTEHHRRVIKGMPGAFVLWYRQSERAIEPIVQSRRIRAYEPEHARHGDLVVQLDTLGRLDRLMAVPPMWPQAAREAPPDPIPILFAGAGLDFARFEPAPAERRCPVDGDEVRAWTGPAREDFVPVQDGPDARRVIVHAGLAEGRAVFLTVDEAGIGPNVFERSPVARTGPDPRNLMMDVVAALLMGGFIVMSVRNLRSGRGDVRGATRVALVVVALLLALTTLAFDRAPTVRNVFCFASCGGWERG
jgi:hypothetical protein